MNAICSHILGKIGFSVELENTDKNTQDYFKSEVKVTLFNILVSGSNDYA